MNLIGIAGTNGSGKDTLGQILANEYAYKFVSVSDMLRDELHQRGQPTSREYARELSAEWRREHGLGVVIDRALDLFNKQPGQYKGLAIASLRNPGEADRIHELGGRVAWVDALPKVRFDRIQANKATRGEHRAADDDISFEKFMSDEAAEMYSTGDAATLDVNAVKTKADIFIDNNNDNVQVFASIIKSSLGL